MKAIKLLGSLFLLNCLLCWVFTSDKTLLNPIIDPILFTVGFLALGLFGFVSIEAEGRKTE